MIVVFRGISGSGKSTLVQHLSCGNLSKCESAAALFLAQLKPQNYFSSFSADHYFMVDGKYHFDPKSLPAAHESCLRKFSEKLQEAYFDIQEYKSDHTIVVDNTNTTIAEVAPYLALAQAYSHELHVVTLVSDPSICFNRNKHEVSFESIIQQDIHLRHSILEWPQRFARYQRIFPH